MSKLRLTAQLTEYLSQLGYRPKTIKIVERGCREFLNRLATNRIDAISRISSTDIIDHYHYLLERPNKLTAGALSSRYIDHHLYSLQLFFEWQQTIGAIEANPMSSLHFPRGESKVVEILTREEILSLYEVCESWKEKTMLSIYYGCGLRRSEGESLDLRDAHFRSGILYVRKGKGSRRRAVPMSRGVSESIYRYVHEERYNLNKLEALVINSRGGRMLGWSYDAILKRLLKKAGIEKRISLHCLRHSIATHLLESGMCIEQVRDFLGHKHLESTMRYTRISKQMLYEKRQDTKELPGGKAQ